MSFDARPPFRLPHSEVRDRCRPTVVRRPREDDVAHGADELRCLRGACDVSGESEGRFLSIRIRLGHGEGRKVPLSHPVAAHTEHEVFVADQEANQTHR